MRRGHPLVGAAALVTLVMVGLLDLLTPSDVSFGQLYAVPVLLAAWSFGVRAGVTVAALAAATELLVDSSVFRAGEPQESSAILAWNALATFIAFAVLAFVTDGFYTERERWRAVNAERARLLRLLEREFPRPLRAIDWFARTFEEAVDRQLPMPEKLREQFSSLRHHTREIRFLATDLLRIGRVRSGDLEFPREEVNVKVLAKEAADESVDRNHVIVRTAAETLVAIGDAEALRHAMSAIIGRLIEVSPSEVIDLLVRGSGDEVAIEFTSRGRHVSVEDLELAHLLITANGGRLTAAEQTAGVRVHVYLPRATSGAVPEAPLQDSARA